MMIMIILMYCWLWHFDSILHLLCYVIFIYLMLPFSHFGYYFNKRLLVYGFFRWKPLTEVERSKVNFGCVLLIQNIFTSPTMNLFNEREILVENQQDLMEWKLRACFTVFMTSVTVRRSRHFGTLYTYRPTSKHPELVFLVKLIFWQNIKVGGQCLLQVIYETNLQKKLECP